MPYPYASARHTGTPIRTTQCWRSGCTAQVGDHDEDELGLCVGCIKELRNDTYRHELTDYERPFNADAGRSV